MGRSFLLLGAGGAAKAVAVGLAHAGARQVTVANRTPEKAQAVAALIPGQGQTIPWDDQALAEAAAQADALVNATSLGMGGQGEFSDFAFLDALPKTALVSDLIYHPAQTRLLAEARSRGLDAMNGLPLLMHQAILALEHFAGVSIPPERVVPALEPLLT